MNSNIGELVVVWTARLAVAAWMFRLLADLSCRPRIPTGGVAGVSRSEPPVLNTPRAPVGRPQPPPEGKTQQNRIVLWVWTAGCLCYLLHVAAAFQFVHHWSHTSAYAHTARQTHLVTGWNWGGGLWINYAFTLWWPLDVLWCWLRQRGWGLTMRAPGSCDTGGSRWSTPATLENIPRWYRWTLHAIFGFLVFNATVVFGPRWWRWVFLLFLPALWLAMRPARRHTARSSATRG